MRPATTVRMKKKRKVKMMKKAKVDELRKQIYDLAEVMKTEASYDEELWEVMDEARRIMDACDTIEAYLEDDPADYEATKRDVSRWLDRKIGVPA